ncbi:hypothetical protein [Algibacter sp. L3A6]|uniref:hypothetical protein n=1 Tax=Algibacter sp. L3A6 TaxID=2686366 RepID=UPI001E4B414F|nr:hypothetical protein [Algibacter sp. L3A6]
MSDIQQKGLSFKQEKDFVKIDVPDSLRDPKVTVVVLDLEDEIAKVVDETLQQQKDGSIVLPVEKCEYKIRRISYDYEEKVTHRWGENPKQGLMWTVNVSQPGIFKIITEDNGDGRLQFEIKTVGDTQILDAKGNLGAMHKKLQTATVRIEKKGIQQIVIHPSKLSKKSSRYKFKGLELIPVDK